MRPLVRIPLTIEVTETGAKTDGVIVAVLASDLDALEAENHQLSNRLVKASDALSRIKTWDRPIPPLDVKAVAERALDEFYGREVDRD